MIDTDSTLEQIAARATKLYSRPTVAMEIVRLTEQPNVDAQAIKSCVENDPALACKILRVVNSSLFGMSREVTDLNQAVALLGTKPLKLLALGFSLPDALFAEVASHQLQWYWTTTLTRAVSARLLSEQLWRQPGDEAFIAALLQDIGVLVLVRELGQPYAKLLAGVIEEKCDLGALEQSAIGFNHHRLSAALLARWKLPDKIVDAVAVPKITRRLAKLASPEADLPQILHLAELLAQLVGQRRLIVLPDLLEAGEAYQALTKTKLDELVGQLQPQVDQLAGVLSLELTSDRNYTEVLVEAHQQMAELVEEFAAGRTPPAQDPSYSRLLEQSRRLSGEVNAFLARGDELHVVRPLQDSTNAEPAADASGRKPTFWMTPGAAKSTAALERKLRAAASRCREKRQELSLLLVESQPEEDHPAPDPEMLGRLVRRELSRACGALDQAHASLVSISPRLAAVVLANCERRAAVSVAHHAIANLASCGADAETSGGTATAAAVSLSVGVATVAGVPKNFDPEQLLVRAERCLNAARLSGISTVKSIEL